MKKVFIVFCICVAVAVDLFTDVHVWEVRGQGLEPAGTLQQPGGLKAAVEVNSLCVR